MEANLALKWDQIRRRPTVQVSIIKCHLFDHFVTCYPLQESVTRAATGLMRFPFLIGALPSSTSPPACVSLTARWIIQQNSSLDLTMSESQSQSHGEVSPREDYNDPSSLTSISSNFVTISPPSYYIYLLISLFLDSHDVSVNNCVTAYQIPPYRRYHNPPLMSDLFLTSQENICDWNSVQ